MGLAVSAVVAVQPWFRSSRLAFSFCFALTSGAALTYALSSQAIVTSLGPAFPKFALVSLGALFALPLLSFAGRGLLQRKTAAMAAWLLIPIAAGCILGYVSGGIGGADHMIKWVMDTLHWSRGQAETCVHYLRKSIHFTAYGLLGLSLFRAAMAGGAPKPRAFVFAILVVLSMASFDEMRQTTSPNRTGSFWDVTLDVSGAGTFAAFAAAICGRRKKAEPPKAVRS